MDAAGSSKKRSFPFVRFGLLLILLLGAYICYTHYFMSHGFGKPQAQASLEVYDARLQNLEKSTLSQEERIKNLEDTIQKLGSAQATPASPVSQPAVASAADNDRIAALEKEMATLKTTMPLQSPEHIDYAIRLLSSFHRLSGKVLSGKPFSNELSAFEDIAKPDESSGSPLSTLAPYADSGIPTFATLLATFDQSAESLNMALSVPPKGAGWWERFEYNLSHIISIRRIDEAQTGNSQEAIIGRAQAHLEREEVEAAMSEIKSLPESARNNFSAWLDDAQMVTETPLFIDQLEEQVMQKAFDVPQPASPTASDKPAEPAAVSTVTKP